MLWRRLGCNDLGHAHLSAAAERLHRVDVISLSSQHNKCPFRACSDPTRIFPDRGLVGMDQPFLRAYTQVGAGVRVCACMCVSPSPALSLCFVRVRLAPCALGAPPPSTIPPCLRSNEPPRAVRPTPLRVFP